VMLIFALRRSVSFEKLSLKITSS